MSEWPERIPSCRTCGEPFTEGSEAVLCELCKIAERAQPYESWRDRARCKDMVGAERDRLFFEGEVGKAPFETRAFCAHCPVQSECLEYALADPSLVGIWAGTTDRQRMKERRRRKLQTA